VVVWSISSRVRVYVRVHGISHQIDLSNISAVTRLELNLNMAMAIQGDCEPGKKETERWILAFGNGLLESNMGDLLLGSYPLFAQGAEIRDHRATAAKPSLLSFCSSMFILPPDSSGHQKTEPPPYPAFLLLLDLCFPAC